MIECKITGKEKTMNTTAPIIQQQELTTRCNNACKFCYNPERCIVAFEPRNEEKQRNIKVAELSVEKGVMAVCPTGGEPFLVGSNLFDILSTYKQADCYISINTNGRLVDDKIAQKLANLGLNSALISLHGVGELHNEMVGDKRAFEETWQGITRLRSNGIPVTPNFVATAKNVHGLKKTGEKLAEIGFKSMTVTPFLPSWGAESHNQFILQKHHYRQYFTAIGEIRRLGVKIDSTLPIPPCVLIKLFPDEWLTFIDVHSPRVCMAGRSFGVVSPDGCFRSCIQAPYLPDFGGNILENYEKSWANANKWAEQNLMPQECFDCHALDICGGGCRTSCMWANKGEVKGKTMYMGEPLTEKQVEVFNKRSKVAISQLNSEQTYQWRKNVKFRDEGWGMIVFNPANQSFTVLSKESSKQKGGVKFTYSKTTQVLSSIGAIRKTENSNTCSVNQAQILPAQKFLPRLARNLNDEKSVHCLRADTGERYFF